jgi:hypothetical protein
MQNLPGVIGDNALWKLSPDYARLALSTVFRFA